MKKLILIDDHILLLDGITSWITKNSDWNVIAQLKDIEEVDSMLENFQKDSQDIVVAIVDLSLSSETQNAGNFAGYEIIKKLKQKEIRSVVFSSYDRGGYVEKAMSDEIGALGFVSKSASEEILLESINMAAQNKVFIQPKLLNQFLNVKNLRFALSPKERDVADLLDSQWNNNDIIAKKMGITKRTVENYICKLYDKTGTSNRDDLLHVLGKT